VHALVGTVEASATPAEEAARCTGADVEDTAEAVRMAFADTVSAVEPDEAR
jgi:hypothetical protein